MAPDDRRPMSAGEALEQLGRLSLRDLSMQDFLQTVTELARSVMPGDCESSVSLLVRGDPVTVVTTGRLALELDEQQYERGHGPCLHAARTLEVTSISDTRTDDRWPDYTRRAADRGNLSSLSIPLPVDEAEQVTGALNIYAREAHAFDVDEVRATAVSFGSYAAVAAGNLHAYTSARERAGNLEAALESRAVIDQAKGILVERYRLTPDQAFQLLARASMHTNRKVRDVAEHLVSTGELLAAGPSRDGRSNGGREG
jgi:GAF domain-containing protein